MPNFKWDDFSEAPASSEKKDEFDWNTHAEAPSDVSMLESAARGAAQGASLGFADEITGGVEALWEKAKGDPGTFGELYKKARDESRANYEAAEKANPVTSTVGQVGGSLATAFVPGLNIAKGAGLAEAAGKAALQGGIAGAGISTSDNLSGVAKDAAEGAALGGAIGGTVHGGLQLVSKYGQQVKDAIPKVLGKAGRLATGVDEEALARQYMRPDQVAAAEREGFSHELSQRVGNEIDARSQYLGENVHKAGGEFLKDFGDKTFDTQGIAGSIEEFLGANEMSPKGFSALSADQTEQLEAIKKLLSTGETTGEDLYKLRQYMDHVERLAGKYDQEGTSPFVRQLKQIRSQADQLVDAADPRLDRANSAFRQNAEDRSMIRSASNEGTAEQFVNNLYDGANKGAKKEAAERVLGVHPELNEQMKDIASNKALLKQGPAGSEMGFRNMAKIAGVGGAFSTGGATGVLPVIMSPTAWKYGLRGLGKAGQALGKYGPILESAAKRGGNSLAATHFVLQQTDPGYQETLKRIEGEGGDNE